VNDDLENLPAERQTEETSLLRDGNGKYTRNPETARRDASAVALRAQGHSYRDIAAVLDVSVSNAYQAVQRALRAIIEEPASELRALELERLDELTREAQAVMRRDHLAVSNGKVVTYDGAPVIDDQPVLGAIDRLVKISERRAKLLGLDAKDAHDMGIADREIALAEGQGRLLVGVIQQILGDLQLSAKQREMTRIVVPRALRAVAAPADPPPDPAA
jgi:sigma-70-like protein